MDENYALPSTSLKTALIVFVLTTLTLLACGPKESELEIPAEPEMGDILRDYTSATAAMNSETIGAIVEAYRNLENYRSLICGSEACSDGLFCFLCPGLSDLDALWAASTGKETESTKNEQGSKEDPIKVDSFGSQTGAMTVGGVDFSGDGYFRASRPCSGGPDSYMNLTTLVDEYGIRPVVWGEMVDCDLEIDGIQGRMTAEFRISLGGDPEVPSIAPDSLDSIETLVLWINGDFVTKDGTYGITLDIKTDSSEGELQLRVPVESKHVLFYFKSQLQYGFDAVNGRWSCDFPEGFPEIITDGKRVQCTHSETAEIVELPL